MSYHSETLNQIADTIDRGDIVSTSLIRNAGTVIDALTTRNDGLLKQIGALTSDLAHARTVDAAKRNRIRAALVDTLGDLDVVRCNITWGERSDGAISEDDFTPVAGDEGAVAELVDAVIKAIES